MKIIIRCLIGLILLIAFWSSWYTLSETERAVMLKMGKPLYEVTDAGLHAKLPWPLRSVQTLERRYQKYDASPRQIITKDKKALEVDTFGYWRVTDGITFLQKMQTNENALARIDDVTYSEMRNTLGTFDLEETVTTKRNEVMDVVDIRVNAQIKQYGIEFKFVRMNKTDFPKENKASVYARMKAERERQAKLYRSEGNGEATKLRSETDKEVTVKLAEANLEAQKNRAIGDAEATRIYNEAYGKDPEFFRLYRGLGAAYTLRGSDTKLVLTGEEPHLKALFGGK